MDIISGVVINPNPNVEMELLFNERDCWMIPIYLFRNDTDLLNDSDLLVPE